VYKTVSKRVEKTPAQTREIEIPAEYTTVSKRVVDQPASTREIEIPAVTKTVTVTKMTSPPSERKIDIPAEYGSVTKTRVVGEPSYVWRSILCETNATSAKIMEIQRALKAAGFNPGKVDGVIRADTMRAVRQYQEANKLPVDDYINVDTVKSLGLSAI
jgi:peptidoglycan hydrolase-like protein with peptidoglycan-binding domain